MSNAFFAKINSISLLAVCGIKFFLTEDQTEKKYISLYKKVLESFDIT